MFSLVGEEEATLAKLLEVVKEFEGSGANSLREFLGAADEAAGADSTARWAIDVPRSAPSVNAMTIHKAKGLGFPVVVVLLYGETGKKMARPEGEELNAAGTTLTDPVSGVAPVLDVCSLNEDLGGIVYALLVLALILTTCPDGFRNSIVPLMMLSVGFTSTTCVVHPPPAAKCGNTIVAVETAAGSCVTGNVVMRNSLRSLVKPRNATTATGMFEANVKVPLNARPLNGA